MSGTTIETGYYYTIRRAADTTRLLAATGATAGSYVEVKPFPTHLADLWYELWQFVPWEGLPGYFTIRNMSSSGTNVWLNSKIEGSDPRVQLSAIDQGSTSVSHVWHPTNPAVPAGASAYTLLSGGQVVGATGLTTGQAVNLEAILTGAYAPYVTVAAPGTAAEQQWVLEKSGVATTPA